MSRAICPLCAHVNPDRARFCNECGAALTLVACAACEAINARDAERCHQCGATLATLDQETHVCVDEASNAMSVPTPTAPGAPSQERAQDRTPIALAERFERQLASPRNPRPRRKYAHKREFAAAVSTEATPFPREISHDEQEIAGEREHAGLPERQTRARSGWPIALLAIVVMAIAAGSYYGWQRTISVNTATQPPSGHETTPPVDATAPETKRPDAAVAPALPHEPNEATSAASPASTAPASRSRPPSALPTPPASSATVPANDRVVPSPPSIPSNASSERRATRVRPSTREPKVDKDALATERLIERDLGKFLPRSETNGSAR